MLELTNIQKNALNKLIKNNESFIFWPRQSGKSRLLVHYIEYLVNNSKDEEIIYVGYDQKNSELFGNKIIYHTPNIIKKYKNKKELSFINNNYITFYTNNGDNLEYLISCLKPTLMLFDDFMFNNKFNSIIPLLSYLKCKLIFTSNYIDFELIKSLDYNNNFYINIIPQYKENWIHDRNSNCYEFEKLVKENLYYKSSELLDFDNIIFQRDKKLKIINKIANGS